MARPFGGRVGGGPRKQELRWGFPRETWVQVGQGEVERPPERGSETSEQKQEPRSRAVPHKSGRGPLVLGFSGTDVGAAEMDRAWPGSQEASRSLGWGRALADAGRKNGGDNTAYKDTLILRDLRTHCLLTVLGAGVRAPPTPSPSPAPSLLKNPGFGLLGHLPVYLPAGTPSYPPRSWVSARHRGLSSPRRAPRVGQLWARQCHQQRRGHLLRQPLL